MTVAGLGSVHAGEVYLGLGLPGVGLGYAHPVSPRFTVRGDIFTLGSRSAPETEDGITYKANSKP